MDKVTLTPALIESFAGAYLSIHYDDPTPIAGFHREAWADYCSTHTQCAVAAPRNHAKSTALTLAYGLSELLFRCQDYMILLGSSEDMAVESLGEFSYELHENDNLISDFGIARFITDQKTDMIVECRDGHQFRMVARGAGQKIRGRKWRGKRPGLLLFDDVEDDEQVETVDQRRKFRNWFFRAAKQAVRLGGKVRGHGTILNDDSMLANLMKNSQWKTRFYKAHTSFNDFSNILWPERMTEEILRARQEELIAAHDAGGYSQEYLNTPLDNSDAYLRADDFLPMKEEDFSCRKIIGAAADFAVSTADSANRTSFTVGGKCSTNLLHYLDFYVGRWSSTVTQREKDEGKFGWIDVMFDIQQKWKPEVFWVEGGVIWKSLSKLIYEEMIKREIFINLVVIEPIKDKATRGRSMQKRHRAGATRWNTQASGYEDARQECLLFSASADAKLDDQFDSACLLSKGFDNFANLEEEDLTTEEEWAAARASRNARGAEADGRSKVTGY